MNDIMIILLWILLIVVVAYIIIRDIRRQPTKTRRTAILLAVFFSFFAWLYVFDDKKNRRKFWLNLCLTLVTVGIWGVVAWLWAMIDMESKPNSYFENYSAKTEQNE